MSRAHGISTLIACQNEEVTVGWCVLSFLGFSDEIIVVDNGSTDRSKDVCSALARQFPEKIRFFDAPQLKDVYENRQYAFERSRYNWIVRADADYVCYTEGPLDCRRLREHLLEQGSFPIPLVYSLPQPNVYGDFWHTGCDAEEHTLGGQAVVKSRLPVMSSEMPRVYRWFPGFRFARLGRWEGVRMGRLAKRLCRTIHWPTPIWMHCDVKSDENYLYRSERTNWREAADFDRFPTLDIFLKEAVKRKYATDRVADGAAKYVQQVILPRLRPTKPAVDFAYPSFVLRAMEENPVYRVHRSGDGSIWREKLSWNAAEGSLL